MSCLVKTTTPFISEEILLEALKKCSCLVKVEKSYNNVYEIKLKEEAERLERERVAFIESQKKAIMEKAKAKGYRVMETKKDNKIQLTLVREVR